MEEVDDTKAADTKVITPSVKGGHENDGKSKYGHRDVIGYGKRPVQPHWPNKAKVALNFVINYEEGGEMCTLHGDGASETLLSDIPGAVPYGTSDP
eukprot:scaffold26184_cov132-Cylindrotheca_fusiformis.AAC.2